MKIGIVTLPLHFNYGGILQAYALWEILRRLGHEVYVVNAPTRNVKSMVKASVYNLSGVSRFVRRYIKRDCLKVPFSAQELAVKGYDALIVGSDQVWRPCMWTDRKEDAHRYFLATTENVNLRKIAYAASFGVDFLDFTREELSLAKCLIKDFVAVSVREKSGITLCTEYFDRTDTCLVLDPAMLLGEGDYAEFILDSPYKTKDKHCFIYLLDYEKEKNQESVNTLLSWKSEEIYAKIERNIFKKYLNSKSTIQNWLSSIYHSDLVITDSFHGCVFSILFHKEFYVVRNDAGGNERIKSLLSLFGLEDRLFDTVANRRETNIHWQEIDDTLRFMRRRSVDFLSKSLG